MILSRKSTYYNFKWQHFRKRYCRSLCDWRSSCSSL